MFRQHLRCVVFVMLALAPLAAVPGDAQASSGWKQIGLLTCVVNRNIGFIIFDHLPMRCEFQQGEASAQQLYQTSNKQLYLGAVNTVGVDAGATDGGVLAWTVFATGLSEERLITEGVPAGALAGEYVGVSGDIGLIVSTGANLLVGGPGGAFALLSIDGAVAFNVVLGVSMLKLRAG